MFNYLRLINIALIVIAGLLGYSLYNSWTGWNPGEVVANEENPTNSITGKSVKPVPLKGLIKETKDHSLAFYQEIVDKDLFSSERSKPEDGATAGSEGGGGGGRGKGDAMDADSSGYILYGIAMVGETRRAVVGYVDIDPQTKRRSEKVRMFKEGDEIGAAKLSQITETAIELALNNEQLTLNVYDPKTFNIRKQNRTPITLKEAPARREAPAKAVTRETAQKQAPTTQTQEGPPAAPSAPPPQTK